MMNLPDNEWSLIIFNILGDLSVGAFLIMGIVHFYAARKADRKQADILNTRALLVLGPILVLGMLAVLAHVGNPDRMFNMLSNIDTSWLAREVLFYGAFLVVGGIFAVLQALTLLAPGFIERLPEGLRRILPTVRVLLAWVAAILGLIFVFSAAMIYYDPRLASRQTGWAHIHTVILFFADTVLLGSLALGVGYVLNYLWVQRRHKGDEETRTIQQNLLHDAIQGTSFLAIAAVGVLFVITPIYNTYLGAVDSPVNNAYVVMLHTEYANLVLARLFLVFTGAGILATLSMYFALDSRRNRGLLYLLVIGAFICVFVAELIARYIFYGANATLLIGGM